MDEHTSASKSVWQKRIRLVGSLSAMALLIWLLLNQDWETLVRSLSALPVWAALAGLALVFARQVSNSARWSFLLRGQDIHLTFGHSVKLVFVGLFASNFLPTTVGGDVVRVVGLVRKSSDSVAGAASVAMDRVIGLISMLFVLPFSWPLLSKFIVNGLAMTSLGLLTRTDIEIRIRSAARRLAEIILMWTRKPTSLLLALLASWMGVLFYLTAVWIVANGLQIPVGFLEVAGATGITYFLTLIPLSINGYGVRELGILAVYTQLGASPEQATVLAILTRAFLLAASLPGALWISAILSKGAEEASTAM